MVLQGFPKALSKSTTKSDLESNINTNISHLANAIASLRLLDASLPEWVREEFTSDELVWLTAAMSAFYDKGI